MGHLLAEEERIQLEPMAAHGPTPVIRRWAQLVLLYDQGLPTREVAERIGLSRGRTRYWRRRFQQSGIGAFPIESGETVDALGLLVPGEAEKEVEMFEPLGQHYPAALNQAEHRRDLALALFDGTQAIHQLSENHRRLLEAAILLQYLAEIQQGDETNKAGYLFLVSHPLTNLSEDEGKIVDQILKRQRGKAKRRPASEIPPEERDAFVLAAVLRIADGLDQSHTQATVIESVASTSRALRVLVSGPQAQVDAPAAQKRSRLWSDLFGQQVYIRLFDQAEQMAESQAMEELMARKSPGIEPGDSLAEAGRKVLGFHFAAMLRHEEGTRAGQDIEELHDMRVATRRMRAAFEVFAEAFEPKVLKSHLKGLRATGRALGRVRDLDVFMEKAQHYLQTLPEEQRGGLDPLLEDWKQERDQDRKEMLEHLDGDDYARFKRKFLAFVTTPGQGARSIPSDIPTPTLVRQVVPALVYSRLAAVRAYESILNTASIEQLHALRIEFKKFRYTLEYFREVFGPEAKDLIELVKTMQDHLGDLNDADVACQILREFLDEWETRQALLPMDERENPEPIVAYLAARHAERHHLMVTFQEVWERFERPEVRQALAAAVSVL